MVKVKVNALLSYLKEIKGFNHPMVKVKAAWLSNEKEADPKFQPPYGES